MQEDRFVGEQLDVFNKLILDLENIGVTINNKDQALLLLCSLPKSYSHFKKLCCLEGILCPLMKCKLHWIQMN